MNNDNIALNVVKLYWIYYLYAQMLTELIVMIIETI